MQVTGVREKRQRQKRKTRRLMISASILLMAIVLLAFLFSFLFRSLLIGYMVNIKTLNQENFMDKENISALLIKSEKVVMSPIKGTITFLVHDGERVSNGFALVKVNSINIEGNGDSQAKFAYAPQAGTAFTNLDGLEDVLEPANIKQVELKSFSQIDQQQDQKPKSDELKNVECGQPVVKLVDNLEPMYILYSIDKNTFFQIGMSPKKAYQLIFQGNQFEGIVLKTEEMPDQVLILMSILKYPDDLLDKRRVEISLLKKQVNAIWVSKQDLVYQQQKPGIFIIRNQSVVWTEVKLHETIQDQVSIEGKNISNGVRYIGSPQLLKEYDSLF